VRFAPHTIRIARASANMFEKLRYWTVNDFPGCLHAWEIRGEIAVKNPHRRKSVVRVQRD